MEPGVTQAQKGAHLWSGRSPGAWDGRCEPAASPDPEGDRMRLLLIGALWGMAAVGMATVGAVVAIVRAVQEADA
jgi:hypothetical protein